jgi:hypothetical protein
MKPELLWELNPNLDAAAKERLGVLARDTRAKCQAIIDNAKATMSTEELEIFLPIAAQAMAWI